MGRPGIPDEVAATIAFAVSPACSFTTGFTFDVSGGRATY
jgi:2-dehydro-3-deoxy-L-rhamnonate dehydrogenase (NAD+)